MTGAQYTEVFRTPGLSLGEFRCRGDDACEHEEHTVCDQIVFVRRGLFSSSTAAHRGLFDPTTALAMSRGQPFYIAHPLPGGDLCTVVNLGQRFWGEAADRRRLSDARGRAIRIDARTHWEHWCLFQQARRDECDALQLAERLVRLVVAVLDTAGPAQARQPSLRGITVRRYRRIAAEVIELLNAEYARSLTLAEIAAQVHCSMYQLCRIFRRQTRAPIHAYLHRLRLRAAVARLAEGDEDLTRVAMDTGFSTPSHFTAAFRREYGLPPSRARRVLSHAIP